MYHFFLNARIDFVSSLDAKLLKCKSKEKEPEATSIEYMKPKKYSKHQALLRPQGENCTRLWEESAPITRKIVCRPEEMRADVGPIRMAHTVVTGAPQQWVT